MFWFLGHTVYVNPGWLAEFSNFFSETFFGKNAGEDLTFGTEVSHEHFIELLRVLCYCPTRKPITSYFLFSFHFKNFKITEMKGKGLHLNDLGFANIC